MSGKSIVSISAVMLLLVSGCGPGKQATLLDSMPEGYTLYFVFDPVSLGVEEILEKSEDLLEAYPSDLDHAEALLGFSPLDWSGWVETFALSEGEDIGFLVEISNDEPELIVVYLPSEDGERIESFFEQFGELGIKTGFFERDNHIIVTMADTDDLIDEFEENLDGGTLSDNEKFMELRSVLEPDDVSLEVYLSTVPDEDFESFLASLNVKESTLELSAAIIGEYSDIAILGEVLSDGQNNADILIPEDAAAVFRISVDINSAAEMAQENFPPDAQMGIAMMGFESLNDMMSMFSGDFIVAAGKDDIINVMISIGLDDSEAASEFLSRLSGFAAMGGETGIETFTFSGSEAYRFEVPDGDDMREVEVGIHDNALYIVSGYSLDNIVDGENLESYVGGIGIDAENRGGMFAAADIEEVMEFLEEMDVPVASVTEGKFGEAFISFDITDGIMSFNIAVEVHADNPVLEIVKIGINAFLTSMETMQTVLIEDVEQPDETGSVTGTARRVDEEQVPENQEEETGSTGK